MGSPRGVPVPCSAMYRTVSGGRAALSRQLATSAYTTQFYYMSTATYDGRVARHITKCVERLLPRTFEVSAML